MLKFENFVEKSSMDDGLNFQQRDLVLPFFKRKPFPMTMFRCSPLRGGGGLELHKSVQEELYELLSRMSAHKKGCPVVAFGEEIWGALNIKESIEVFLPP